jgi:hypothetical protein
MTEGERRLAILLALACAASVVFAAAALGVERIGDARERIVEYERRISLLASVAVDKESLRARLRAIESGIDRAEQRARAASGASIPTFGRDVKRLLSANGISPGKYQAVSGARGEELEFSLRCGIGDFLGFLRAATEGQEGWTISYLSLHTGAEYGRADVVMRLSR